MPSKRSRRKSGSDWEYVTKVRHKEQLSLRIDENSVRQVLIMEHVEDVESTLRGIIEGGIWLPTHGWIKSIHRMKRSVEDFLKETSAKVRKLTTYGTCYWNRFTGTVWWSFARVDKPYLQGGHSDVSPAGEIRKLFKAHKEVQHVRIEQEACPDLRVDARWKEVYPGRL